MRKQVWIGLSFLLAQAAFADDIKPGLWETVSTMDAPTGAPAISAEQAERMSKLGIQLPYGHPITVQTCITPEMAARWQGTPQTRPNDLCQMQDFHRTGNSVEGKVVCSGDTKGEGVYKVKIDSDTSYSATYDFSGTTARGPLTMHVSGTSHFIAADCGSVKPYPLPK